VPLALKTLRLITWLAILGCNPLRAAAPEPVDNSTMLGKALMGYQGWFSCPGDGSDGNGWHHWFRKDKLTVDMWPDVSEFGPDELFATRLKLPDGSPAKLFSSINGQTVARHFKWMKEAGIDGILLQRFIGEVQNPRFFKFRNEVTTHVRESAEATGRVFALEYDMAADQSEDVVRDWKFLVDEMKITTSPRYLHHKGKPVLCLWGLGFTHRKGTPEQSQVLINWLRHDAPERYRATVVGGVPAGWRTGTGDSLPGNKWAKVYQSLDVISPWTVGRYRDDSSADAFLRKFIIPDLAETKRLGIDYLPVVFPGFSWKNLHQGPPNQIPRRGGDFYWHQVVNASTAGAAMLKIAMFDEVDEGTAMFKSAANKTSAPADVWTLTLDADGQALPSDWYLRLAGETSRLMRKEIQPSLDLPIKP